MAEKPREHQEEQPKAEIKYKGERTWQEALENKGEIYSAKELFDLIQTNGLAGLDPERMKKELLERGQKEEDIDLSLKLMACISVVQRITFDGKGIDLQFMSGKHLTRPDSIAMYRSEADSPKEKYLVCVEGLYKIFSKLEKIVLVDKNGNFVKNKPQITLEEDFLGIAIHEVRHRLQYQNGFKMFSPDNIPLEDKQLDKILKFTKAYLNIRKEDSEKEGVSQEIIDGETNPKEFDSRVIQTLANNRIHEGITLEEFFNLTKIQPAEKKE